MPFVCLFVAPIPLAETKKGLAVFGSINQWATYDRKEQLLGNLPSGSLFCKTEDVVALHIVTSNAHVVTGVNLGKYKCHLSVSSLRPLGFTPY